MEPRKLKIKEDQDEVRRIIEEVVASSDEWILSPAYRLGIVTQALQRSGCGLGFGYDEAFRRDINYHGTSNETAFGLSRLLIESDGIPKREEILTELLRAFTLSVDKSNPHNQELVAKAYEFLEKYGASR